MAQEKVKKNIEKSVQDQIKSIVDRAKSVGVSHFIVGFQHDGIVSTHLENIPASEASRIIIALFTQLCDVESSQGHMSKEYRATMEALKMDFLKLIKAYNNKFEAIKNPDEPVTPTV